MANELPKAKTKALESEIVGLVENTAIELKVIARKLYLEFLPKEVIRKEAMELIDTAYKKIKSYEGYEDYAESFKTSMLGTFAGWYSQIIVKLSILAKRNKFAKDVLNQVKGLKDKGQKNIRGNFIINANGIDFQTKDGIDTKKYLTSGESGYSQMMIKDYTNLVESSMNEIAQDRPVLKDKLGRNMSLRNLAEMTVRHNARNEVLDELRESGVKLVMISEHVNCSKRCQPFQGKVYSLDNSSGVTKDKNRYKYKPLKEATANHQLFGYNCRHRAFKYIEDMDKPKAIPPEQIKKERMVEETQRALERTIISLKSKAKLLPNADTKNDIKEATTYYRKFCKDNNLVVLNWRIGIE